MNFRHWLEMAMDLTNVDDPFDKEFQDTLAKNKKKAIVYHGTSTTHFWNIVNQGFTFDSKRRNWLPRPDVKGSNGTSPGVYFSFSLDRAGMYTNRAIETAGGEGIIFVLEVPIGILEQDVDDKDTWDKGTKYQSMVKDEVNPKYITGVIYPATGTNAVETPIKKFIDKVNKGKIPDIQPEQWQVKRKFATATLDDPEHRVISYIHNLLQYTSFEGYNLGQEGVWMNRQIMLFLNKLGKDWWFKVYNWTGDDWVAVLEKITGKKNEEDYYKTQKEFQVPMSRAMERPDIMGYKKFRLGVKNPKNPEWNK